MQTWNSALWPLVHVLQAEISKPHHGRKQLDQMSQEKSQVEEDVLESPVSRYSRQKVMPCI
jgi:hypothetical protein